MESDRSTPATDINEVLFTAAITLGYETLKPQQTAVIKAFVSGRDVFAALPTGYKKSVCFTVLPLVFDKLRGSPGSIVLCVSPLTLLMLDQRSKFSPRGLSVEFVGEAQESSEAMNEVKKGKVQLVYTSPESLISIHHCRSMLSSDVYRQNLVAFVVDKAHCVKKW